MCDNKLKKLRKSKGFSTRFVCEKTGISMRTLQYLEKGERTLDSFKAIYPLAKLYGLRIEELLDCELLKSENLLELDKEDFCVVNYYEGFKKEPKHNIVLPKIFLQELNISENIEFRLIAKGNNKDIAVVNTKTEETITYINIATDKQKEKEDNIISSKQQKRLNTSDLKF